MAQQGSREYRVRMCRTGQKKYHIMRFKPPHKCDLEKLHNPTLERQHTSRSEAEQPQTGEGSEYGRQLREESRKRKRGYASKKKEPDDNPWILREKKKGGKHFVSRKEGSVNANSSYYVLTFCEDGVFEAYPVNSWYDFVPPVKYDYLDAEEAEKKFEQRHKTLNYFSVMLSRRLREEEGEGGGEGGEVAAGGKKKNAKRKDVGNLYLTDSESNKSYSSDEEQGASSHTKKGKGVKRSRRKAGQKEAEEGEEPGEETDEGDMEGQEVDYMSRSSSESEEEYQAKKALKEVPKDDEEVERKEEGEIDRGFTESSSSSDEELTEAGKQIQALMKKQTGTPSSAEEEEAEAEEEEEMEMETTSLTAEERRAKQAPPAVTTATHPDKLPSGTPRPVTPSKTHSKSKSDSTKKDRKKTSSSTPQKRPLEKNQQEVGVAGGSGAPPSKKSRAAESTSTITEDEVRRYLSRKPISSKELLKKFTSKKTDIDKSQVPKMLSQIIKRMSNVEERVIDGKLHLSLKTTVA